ncbi:MAG: hypothetical protein EBZ36_18970, partial [Acidobacteria bacterium]|nr:hypothetical protein [Acidobacteriota bacterium]
MERPGRDVAHSSTISPYAHAIASGDQWQKDRWLSNALIVDCLIQLQPHFYDGEIYWNAVSDFPDLPYLFRLYEIPEYVWDDWVCDYLRGPRAFEECYHPEPDSEPAPQRADRELNVSAWPEPERSLVQALHLMGMRSEAVALWRTIRALGLGKEYSSDPSPIAHPARINIPWDDLEDQLRASASSIWGGRPTLVLEPHDSSF